MSGEVFSQSSMRSKNKKKERVVQEEEKPTENIVQDYLDDLDKVRNSRIDTKDGSMYLGDLISEDKTSYKLKIISDDIITINKSDVKKAKTPDNAIVLKKGRYHNTKGLFLHYSVGLNAGYEGSGFMADAGLGYRLSKNIELTSGLGFLGTQIRLFQTQRFWGEYKTFFPAYVGVKYNLTHNSVRAFASAKVGYSSSPIDNLIWNQNALDMSGGAYLEPGIGLSFASKRLGQSSISISQVIQYSNFTLNTIDRFDNLVTGTGKVWIKRIGIKLTTTIF